MLSKVVPLSLARGTFNSGFIATSLSTVSVMTSLSRICGTILHHTHNVSFPFSTSACQSKWRFNDYCDGSSQYPRVAKSSSGTLPFVGIFLPHDFQLSQTQVVSLREDNSFPEHFDTVV